MTALAACAALAVAGCGTVHAPAGFATQPSTRPGASLAVTPSPSASPSHQQRAEADAAAILASFVPPPGARRLATAPSAGQGALRQASQTPGAFHLLDKVSWWLAPGQPQHVLAWEQAHLPHQFASAGTSSAGDHGTIYMWGAQFSLPPVPNLLPERYLLVEVVSAGGGKTAIRVDSQVIWLPVKPASERVPSSAQVVTLTFPAGIGSGNIRRTGPVTVTDPAVVRRIAALVDGLPLAPWAYISCPMYTGGGVVLTFRARVGGPVLATVSATADGCPPATVTVDGKQQPALNPRGSFVNKVAALAGVSLRGESGHQPGGGLARGLPAAGESPGTAAVTPMPSP
jgi:hypothetical protein